ncbi:MAG TPA: serine/threonine-protein kinase [Nannocystaceae bacterium]|nr:serine/threonine-protein kinase [Nannocystaceae bacterium]
MTSDERASSHTVQGADTVVVAGSDDAEARRAAEVGTNIGRYVVLAEIGRGGMGRVLRAYDPKLQREVALKEVRSRLLGPIGARRLVAEARAMAKLAHPNVVAVYDVEELPHDQVVVVMEYVAGDTLTKWVAGRTWPEIVACFRRAGRGLAAAHAVGLLHRDFKPDNVLIADGNVVKVTDFGLAKIAGDDVVALPPSGDDEGLTATGAVLGTPRFMAPEQHRGEQLGPAADQYAFCVALWFALTDRAPFDGADLEALERAKSNGPPAWPGGPTPRAIVEAILRGLAPDPARRWPSLDALLDALAFDPAQRRRRWLRATAAIGVVAATAFGVQRFASTRAQRCTDTDARARLEGAWDDTRRVAVRDALLGAGPAYAEGVWTRAGQTLDAYALAWTSMHVEACAATTIRGEQSSAVMDLRMACLHRAKLELAAITNVLAHADAQTLRKTHDMLASLPRIDRCADVDALQADVAPPLPEDAERVDTLRAELANIGALAKAGRYDEVRRRLDAATASAEGLGYAPILAKLAFREGLTRSYESDHAGADAALRKSLTLATEARDWIAMGDAASFLVYTVGYREQRFDEALAYFELAEGLAAGDPAREADLAANMAPALHVQGKLVEAEAEYRRILALQERLDDPDDPDTAMARTNLANVLHLQGKYEQAMEEHRIALAWRERALGADHPSVGTSLNSLGASLYFVGKYDEAEAADRRALALLERAFGPDHPEVSQSRSNLAVVLQALGRLEEAEVEQRRALAVRERTLAPDHTDIAQSRVNLAHLLGALKRPADAEVELRRALASYEHALGTEHPNVATVRVNLATSLREQGKSAEAEREFRAAIPRMEAGLGPTHLHVGMARTSLAGAIEDQGRKQEAADELRRALAIFDAAVGTDHPDAAVVRTELARMLLDLGEHAEARGLVEAAWTRQQRDDVPPARRGATAFVLARSRWADGDRERAIELGERALAELTAAGEDTKEAREWLAATRTR